MNNLESRFQLFRINPFGRVAAQINAVNVALERFQLFRINPFGRDGRRCHAGFISPRLFPTIPN